MNLVNERPIKYHRTNWWPILLGQETYQKISALQENKKNTLTPDRIYKHGILVWNKIKPQ